MNLINQSQKMGKKFKCTDQDMVSILCSLNSSEFSRNTTPKLSISQLPKSQEEGFLFQKARHPYLLVVSWVKVMAVHIILPTCLNLKT